MVPLLPCRTLDETIPFYEALGFKRTYRQDRPNPAAVVELDDIGIHLFGMDGFVPANSYGSVLIQVSDPDALYQSFAEGLRKAYGKLPVAGIPRILRPRKRQGSVYGFTVVDPGGNWLRISKLPSADDRTTDDAEDQPSKGLALVIKTAARQGDSHGDEAAAIQILTRGLARHADAPAVERVRALLYLAELAARTGDEAVARASLTSAMEVTLDPADRALLAEDLAQATQVVDDLGG